MPNSPAEMAKACASAGCVVVMLPCDLDAIAGLARKSKGRIADGELTGLTGCLVAGTRAELARARAKVGLSEGEAS